MDLAALVANANAHRDQLIAPCPHAPRGFLLLASGSWDYLPQADFRFVLVEFAVSFSAMSLSGSLKLEASSVSRSPSFFVLAAGHSPQCQVTHRCRFNLRGFGNVEVKKSHVQKW